MTAGLFLDGLTTGAMFFLVTLGLLIIFGMMRIINFAYGAFVTVGAYVSVITTAYGISPWWSLLMAPLAAALLAMAIEPLIVRKLYKRPIDTILATWGLSLVITQLIVLYFGRGTQVVKTIDMGAVSILGTTYSAYRIALVPIAVVLGVALVFTLNRTRLGLIGRAVIMDENLAQSMGVNISLVRFATFVLGSSLAGFAGALLAPLASVDPNLGLPWLLAAFMISLLVGVSTYALAMASLLLGFAQVLVGDVLNATMATLAVPILVVLILRVRPQGFLNA